MLGSPMQSIRQCFDLMNYDSADDWAVVAERMTHVRESVASFRASLEEGMRTNLVAARRQALACALQAETWGGLTPAEPFFRAVAERYTESRNGALGASLTRAADDATAAYAGDRGVAARHVRAGRWSAMPSAPTATRSRPAFCGMDLDLAETYEWGWEELYRIEHAMREVGERILPGEGLRSVIAHLETDEHRAIEGVDPFQHWLQDLIDRSIAELNGTHFDLAEPLLRCEAMIAPAGGTAAMYYTGTERRLLPPRPHVVPDARQDPLPALARSVDLLPRGRSGPSSPDRAGALPRRRAEPLPAHRGVRLRSRRGLGAVRRAAHGRARLPRRSRLRARHALGAGDARCA